MKRSLKATSVLKIAGRWDYVIVGQAISNHYSALQPYLLALRHPKGVADSKPRRLWTLCKVSHAMASILVVFCFIARKVHEY